jgi:dTDP-4-dehydrorhamnose 3,5-epimerase
MQFHSTILQGAWRINFELGRDNRGYFAKTFCANEFAAQGLGTNYPRHSISYSGRKGTLRGTLYQREPDSEMKVVRCVKGCIWDVIIDVRPDSPTYCRWLNFELSSESGDQLYIPTGFAHGFQTLCDDVVVRYLISAPYALQSASGIRYDDGTFGINWPLPVMEISVKGSHWPEFCR